MKFFLLIPYYISWHYTTAVAGCFKIWGNYLWFVRSFFSLPLLITHLFSPWQRRKEKYTSDLTDIEDLAASLVANILMRIIGFLVRSITVVVGLLVLLVVFIVGLIFIIFWFILPFLLLWIAFLSVGSIIEAI